MKRVLVTGASGMLGTELCLAAPAGTVVVGTDLRANSPVDVPGLDLADGALVERLFSDHGPFDGVIHAAAFTAVDLAEEREGDARRSNEEASRVLATQCAKHSIPLVLVSTDFVFDGNATRPYREEDPPRPLSAKTRLRAKAGEEASPGAAHHQIISPLSGFRLSMALFALTSIWALPFTYTMTGVLCA